MKLKIKDFPKKRMIEIEGINYSYEFFKFFSEAACFSLFRLIKRNDDGVITIVREKHD